MIDYNYIMSKKHNEILDSNYIKILCNLNNKYKKKSYIKPVNVENIINLELNNLNNNNIKNVFSNIKKHLLNDENNKIFINLIINNSIIQHNNIINYVYLYKEFYNYKSIYNDYIIDYCFNYINNINKENYTYKDKYIGIYIFISYCYNLNIINLDNILKFINVIHDECDDYEYELKLNSLTKYISIISNKLNNNILEKLKNRIEYLSKNINNKRLKFICLDILDNINI